MGSSWGHLGVILGSLWGHLGITLGSRWHRSGTNVFHQNVAEQILAPESRSRAISRGKMTSISSSTRSDCSWVTKRGWRQRAKPLGLKLVPQSWPVPHMGAGRLFSPPTRPLRISRGMKRIDPIRVPARPPPCISQETKAPARNAHRNTLA